MRILVSLVLILAVSACATTHPSESHYTPGEMATRADVERCRVLETRIVDVDATPEGSTLSPGPDQVVLGGLGMAIGLVLGSQIGGGSGNDLAIAAGGAGGAMAGQYAGRKLSERRNRGGAVEYSVLLANGDEQVITQRLGKRDRVVRAGDTCRIATSARGLRVLPGEHLPERVRRPRTSGFGG